MKSAWKSPGTAAALMVLLTAIVYLPTPRSGFIWDDKSLIVENRMVHAPDGLYRFWFTADTADYRPLTWSLWWLEWQLWDGKAAGYHVVNVLLHAVNAILVWLILRRLKITGAWLAAALFAVHPVNAATVAWVSEQKNTLSMLFFALSILFYLRFDEESGSSRALLGTSGGRWPRSARGWYVLSLAMFLLAILSKTAVVMLPVVLLGCVWWRHGQVRWRDWPCSLPYFAASLILALVTIVQHRQALEGNVVQTGGFATRLATAGWEPWFYLCKALVPVNLTVIYPKWNVDASRWTSYIPGMILIACLVVFWWKRKTWGQPLLFGLGYFVVMLFPVLGFFDQGFYRYSWVADHWQYYSIVGVIALAVGAGRQAGSRIGRRGLVSPLGAGLASVIVLTVLGVATWKRNCVYADAETLWRDNVVKNPEAWVAHYNLGVILRETNRIQEAIPHYQQALRIKPDLAEGYDSLAGALAQLGRVREAIADYERALRIEPHYVRAQNNLAWLLATLPPQDGGNPVRAVSLAEQACQRAGNELVPCLDTLAVAYAAAGRFDEAVATSQKAIELAQSGGQAELAKDIGTRLQLYRNRRPYHRPDDVTRPHKP